MATTQTVDLTPAQLDIDIWAGDQRDLMTLTVQVGDPLAAVDISLDTFLCQVRKKFTSTDVLATIDVRFYTDGTDGIIILSIDSTNSRLSDGRLKWDLQWTQSNGDVITLIQGNFVVSGDVSRA